jgi:protein TonB
VISCEVKVSSGHKALDDAAVASIDKASPFPPMPNTLNQAQIEVSVPFKFSIR